MCPACVDFAVQRQDGGNGQSIDRLAPRVEETFVLVGFDGSFQVRATIELLGADMCDSQVFGTLASPNRLAAPLLLAVPPRQPRHFATSGRAPQAAQSICGPSGTMPWGFRFSEGEW